MSRQSGRSHISASLVFPSGEELTVPGFGPTDGAQAVRDGAGPKAVMDPGIGTTFTTRLDLQNKINAGATGATYVHASGGSMSGDATINCGTKQPKIYFLGLAGSTATTIDGGGASRTGFTSTSGSGFEIRGGTFTGFGSAEAPDPGIRAIRMNGPGLVEDALCHTNTIGLTATLDADGAIFRRCTTRDNGQYGITGSGTVGNLLNDLTVEYCILRHNNTGGHTIGFDSGGSKFNNMRGGLFRFNVVDDNIGYGLWWDTNCEDALIEENVCEDNFRAGIFWEANQGRCTIQRNAVLRNSDTNNEAEGYATKSNLLVSRSDGLGQGAPGNLITLNIVDGNKRSIWLHGAPPAQDSSGTDVYNNDIWLRAAGATVGADDGQTVRTMHNDPTLTWRSNTYHVLDMGTSYWRWPSSGSSSVTLSWAGWQALDFDTAGTRELI